MSMATDKVNRREYMQNRYRNLCSQHPKVYTTIAGITGYVSAPGKRPRPEECELCGRRRKYMAYHHWDDSDVSKGMWLCNPCHTFAEGADDGKLHRYWSRKLEIEREFNGLSSDEPENLLVL